MQQEIVTDYLRETCSLPWLWGTVDCMMWSAGLVLEATGSDPAAGLRKTYQTERDAKLVLSREGGALAVAGKSLDHLLRRDRDALWGVCLTRHDIFGCCAAVLADGLAMLKTDGGVIISSSTPLVRWRL